MPIQQISNLPNQAMNLQVLNGSNNILNVPNNIPNIPVERRDEMNVRIQQLANLPLQDLNPQALNLQPLNLQALNLQPLNRQPLNLQALNLQALNPQPLNAANNILAQNNIANIPNVLDQIMNVGPRDKNLLHMKPISHQMGRGITFIGTVIQQSANQNLWHGKMKIGIAKGIVAVGYALNIVIAAIESVAAFTFAALALSLHAITRGRSTLMQKITLKMCAYWLNTILVAGVEVYCLKKGYFSKYHSLNALGNNAVHGVSALVVQFIGYGFDRWAGRNPVNNDTLPPSAIRAIRTLIELVPAVLRDTSKGAARDFSVHIRNNQNNPNLQVFLRNNPDYAEILNRFNLNRLRTDPAYRGDLLRLLGNYFVQAGVLNGINNINMNGQVQAPQAGGQIDVFGVNNNENDKNYQDGLKTIIKNAYIELYANEQLVCMLSDNDKADAEKVQSGRSNLKASVCNEQLAHYAQLQEIKNEIACPETFSAQELRAYNNRRALIQMAKTLYNELTEREKQILTEKLLKKEDFEIQGLEENRKKKIQELFNDIRTLATQLPQGNLLKQNIVDIRPLNLGNFDGAFASLNLFQRACYEAKQEIEYQHIEDEEA